jgi:hypothetical protein
MIVSISRVRAGGETLARKTLLRVGDETYNGLKPLFGVNAVAGINGSGKTLLAEALWLGVVHTLSGLLRDERFHDMLLAAVRAYGVRPIDAEFTVCLSDVEVPELKDRTCIKTEVSGMKSKTNAPEEVLNDEELRRRLVYALAQIISLPDRMQVRAVYTMGELHRAGLLKLVFADPGNVPQELCLATTTLMPPVAYEDAGIHMPCYMRILVAPFRRELTSEAEKVDEELYFYAPTSRGSMSYALFEATYEAARVLSKLAREEHEVSVVPIVYIDDAFEGLDMKSMRSLLSRDYGDVSIYAATHRLEAGMYTARNFVLTYGTRASELVEQPRDFRFALVDASLVEKHKDVFEDVSAKLIGPQS